MKKGTFIFVLSLFFIMICMLIFSVVVYSFITLIREQGEVSPQVYQEEVVDEEYEDSICECR